MAPRPWAFKDARLESRFQKYLVESLMDRASGILATAFSITLVFRFILIVFRNLFAYRWTIQETAFTLFRMMFTLMLIVLLLCRWSQTAKTQIAIAVIWMFRFGVLPVCAEQAGFTKFDTLNMFYPVMFTVTAGIIFPSFKEFIAYTVLIFLVKPAAIILLGADGCPKGIQAPCPDTDLQTVLIQNTFLVCMTFGIFCQIHSDLRHHWLLSFHVFGPLNEFGPVTAIEGRDPETLEASEGTKRRELNDNTEQRS